MKRFTAYIAVALLCLNCFEAASQTKKELAEWFRPACKEISDYLDSRSTMRGNLTVESVVVKGNKLQIHFSRYISDRAIRNDDLERINSIIASRMPAKYRDYKGNFELYSNDTPLRLLVSRHASGLSPDAAAKSNVFPRAEVPLVRNLSHPIDAPKGLSGRHIALWQSHGLYYDQSQARWKWQRPRLFQTCEDLFTQSFVLPFLVPMLENAGANVLLPRERDIQSNELIVDRDNNSRDGIYSEVSGKMHWEDTRQSGFSHIKDVYTEGDNPFKDGKARQVESTDSDTDASTAFWAPEIENDGEYAVYVSYVSTKQSTPNAIYTVHHNGGETRFSVNQTMGGSTWIYLGTFGFASNGEGQGVSLTNNTGRSGELVTADAVRFGGGMGNVSRSPYPTDENGRPRKRDFEARGEVSGYPRWCEGSRSWLQWAGMNDTIYSVTKFTDDYYDDYKSRALWVNALLGGSTRAPKEPGYKIPIDLSFAFHSDAGLTQTDSIVGTLSIYTKTSEGSDYYPHGGHRTIGREYADMVQTQIVEDLQATVDPTWSRRGIWDKSYYESRVPFVPAMLLELLSHQNFADMRYGHDPSFKFKVSRAVYKGMLRFLAYLSGDDYVVQPLPVNSVAITVEKSCARLSWKPTSDPLEPSAEPESYIVYTRITDPSTPGIFDGDAEVGIDGFDNGTRTDSQFFKMIMEPGKIYSFKVAAVNEGGESLCSEILSAGVVKGATLADVIVVNNFDRLAPPASFASSDTSYAGFMNSIDGGVPYMRDISFTGEQYEFRRNATWLGPEPAYFGASYGDWEDKVVAGNSFDYPLLHGAAILAAGLSFTSASRDAVIAGDVDLNHYRICDLVCGKQVRTPKGWETVSNGQEKGRRVISYNVFPAGLRDLLVKYTKKGGSLLVSGAYVASDSRDRIYDFEVDADMTKNELTPERKFVEDILKVDWITNHGGNTGVVRGVQSPYKFTFTTKYNFYHTPNPYCYCVESPDGIGARTGAFSIFKYDDSGISAAVAYRGSDYRCVTFGFPLETLTSRRDLNALMKETLSFLK